MNLPDAPAIDRLETVVVRLPMHGSLQWGKAGALDEARLVLVTVTLRDGAQGVAEAPPRPTIYGETDHSITGIIAQELAPRLVGAPPATAPGLLAQVKNNQTARGAVDMALHHAVAVSQGRSLAEHLGAVQPRLKVSYILGIGPRDEILAEAARVHSRGVRVFKVKVGRDWAEDLARLRELQAHFGPETSFYADANECFGPADATQRLVALREAGLLYCEEPLPVEAVRERAGLRARGILPLIADDCCFSLRDLHRELTLDTFDILNIKTARTGYTESGRMLAQARAAGKGVMVGSQAGAGLGTARAAIFAARPGIEHPSELSFFLKLKEDIVTPTPVLHDGYLQLDQMAELQIDADRLRELAV